MRDLDREATVLYEDEEILDSLRALARADEDMLQELRLHLWTAEQERPGKTRSWYLQSCWYRSRKLLRTRQRKSLRELPLANQEAELLPDESELSDIVGRINAQQMLFALYAKLPDIERAILHYRSLDHGVREIGKLLRLSKTQVSRHCQHIEAVARQLGFTPPITLLGETENTETGKMLVVLFFRLVS